MSGQIICIGLQTGVIPIARAFTHRAGRLSDRKNQTCLIENSEFDCSHMTIGLQTGRHSDRHV